jgi:hypothetical protein
MELSAIGTTEKSNQAKGFFIDSQNVNEIQSRRALYFA